MKRQDATSCVTLALILLSMTIQAASFEHSEQTPSETPNETPNETPSVNQGSLSASTHPHHLSPLAADHTIPYGTTYIWSSNFSDAEMEGMRAQLQYVHSLAVNTLIQMHDPYAPPAALSRFLDEANVLGIKVIVRLSGTTVDPPWGWDGEQFNWDRLTSFLAADDIVGHPAMLAIYGFHIPWDDFTPGEIQRFYTEFHQIAGNIPLYHDLVWVNETPETALLPGMCDLCEISSMPHSWRDGDPVNNEVHITEKIVRYTTHIRQADPNAQIWIQAQTFGWDYDDPVPHPNFRMPTAAEMHWHADLLVEHVDFDGLLWYPYYHTYGHQLGDDDMQTQRQAVHSIYMAHFAPDWTPTDWIYLPLVLK